MYTVKIQGCLLVTNFYGNMLIVYTITQTGLSALCARYKITRDAVTVLYFSFVYPYFLQYCNLAWRSAVKSTTQTAFVTVTKTYSQKYNRRACNTKHTHPRRTCYTKRTRDLLVRISCLHIISQDIPLLLPMK